jgi:hypothetical protein
MNHLANALAGLAFVGLLAASHAFLDWAQPDYPVTWTVPEGCWTDDCALLERGSW